MKGLNTHVGTTDRALQEAPEVLHTVSVDIAVNVLLSVVNDLVGVLRIKPIVREQLIRHDFGSAPNVLANDYGKFMLPASLDVLDMDLPGIALKQPENDLLSDRTATVDLGFPWASVSPDDRLLYATVFGYSNITTFHIDGLEIRIAKDPACPQVEGDGTFRGLLWRRQQ